MVLFMFDELLKIFNRLLGLIFRNDKLNEAGAIIKKMKIEWLNNKENHLKDGLVDLDAATTDESRKVQVSTEKKRKVRKDCKTIWCLKFFLSYGKGCLPGVVWLEMSHLFLQLTWYQLGDHKSPGL